MECGAQPLLWADLDAVASTVAAAAPMAAH